MKHVASFVMFEASVEGTFMCDSQSRRKVSCFRVVRSAVRLLTYIPDDAISLHLVDGFE